MASQCCLLAVLSPEVAQCPAGAAGGRRGDEVLKMFGAAHEGSISMHFGDDAALRYRSCGQHNRQFASFDGIFCVFTGSLHNLPQLRQTYGLCKSRVNEPNVVIEMYKALRDRAPFPVSHAVAQFKGTFSFILYDSLNRAVLVAMDGQGKYPLYWGTCQDGTLALSDDVDVLRQGCSTSFAPFPAGCFFNTSSGLSSFEHPSSVLKAVPHIDLTTGNVCGSKFVVDLLAKMDETPTHVGSRDLRAL